MNSLEKTFDEWFVKKAPYQLSTNTRETIVRWSPWITLILLLFFAPAALAIFGIGTLAGGAAQLFGVHVSSLYYLSLFILVAQVIIMALALPGLFRRKFIGWQLVYYSVLISLVYSILHSLAYAAVFNIVTAAIVAALELYFLFQIRGYYT